MRSRRLLALAVCAVVASACGQGGTTSDGTVQVVAAFYPLQFLVEQVGGDRVQVENLTPPGAEPHDLELTARQTARITEADLAVVLAGFQPAVDEATDGLGDRRLDLAAVEPLTNKDPHVWLDPVRMKRLTGAVADALVRVDPSSESSYRSRAATLTAELDRLDRDFRAGLAHCERRALVTSHSAFGYLTARYGLSQIGISGLSPDQEPSPRRLAEVAALAKAQGVTTIFFEEVASPAVAKTIAREVGAKAEVLSTLEGAPATGDYLSAMRSDLSSIRAALGCA
jgi:zinc transport system substrate-binding protein